MRIIPLDEPPHPCGYLPNLTAQYESFVMLDAMDEERNELLGSGYRSFGKYYFRPWRCHGCQRCIPLRVPVETFLPSKSQRRVLRHCQGVKVTVDRPAYTKEKYEIYQDHLHRFQKIEQEPSKEEDFIFSFYDRTVRALEFCYYLDSKLIAVGIVNETPNALSSVYFTYRLAYSKLSLGTFSVLQEIAYAKAEGKGHLYLGYYIAENHFMAYKASFEPNEILKDGQWVPFGDRKRQKRPK